MTEKKVLIVGAGLGGLVLANILKKNGVPFELFERDEKLGSRKQGWAVALMESLPQLRKELPESLVKDLGTNSVNFHTQEHDVVGFVDATTGKQVGAFGGVPADQKGGLLRVSRLGLRNYLLERGEILITMGKNFSRYEQRDQSVTAFFKDGTSATGSLLVGADGVHSHVLDQLVGPTKHRPVLSKCVPIFGEVSLPPQLYEPLQKLGNAVILSGAPGILFQVGALGMDRTEPKSPFFWTLMPRREEPQALVDWLDQATSQEVYDFVLDITKDFHPTLRDVLTYGGVQAVFRPPPRFLEFPTPDELPRGRAIVLGDAAHAMIPLRGAGANTAMRDACELGSLLSEAHKAQKDYVDVVEPYLTSMIPRGRENVLWSRAAGESKGSPAEEWAEKFRREQLEK